MSATVAMVRGQSLFHAMEQSEKSFTNILSEQNKQRYQHNTHILTALFRTIPLCGRQDIPFRGHRDDNTSTTQNKGNFLAILDEIKYSDEIILKNMDTLNKNALYTSKTIQN